MAKKDPKDHKSRDSQQKSFRSQAWFGGLDANSFAARGWLKGQGLPHHLFDGRPVIGICNTASDLTPCNAHLDQIAEHVKRGIYEAGGFPLEFPVTSLGETLMRPTTMMFRNLASMDVEETIRANPIDAVVLLTGCDKTTPALVMGAASCDLPTIVVSGGPMLNGKFRGQDIGSGTNLWRYADDLKTGAMSFEDFLEAESCMTRSAGHCMTMGTASTMAAMVEALGLALPTNAAIPAVDSRRYTLAHMSGRRIVEMAHEDLKISKILTRQAFENSVLVNGAIGGSTNAVVHSIAIAGRIGVDLDLDDWDRLGSDVPCLVNLMPSGEYLMEDFYYAGGLPQVMRDLGDLLHLDAPTVSGRSVGENIGSNPGRGESIDRKVIHSMAAPFKTQGGLVVLKGNLAPDGAILKPSAASPELMQHKGRAVVFEDIDDYKARIDDPDLDVVPDDILVLKNCGPKGYPGFPEVGNMSLPAKILAKGVRDMVRISDARMSGTAFGTVVLHTAPEAAAGGTLALVRDGDMITLDVLGRGLHLDVDEATLAARRKSWSPPTPPITRGWYQLHHDHVQQADKGADLDFLVGASGAPVPRESH